MKHLFRAITILLCLTMIPVSAIATAAIKQRFADGPNRVFSGGPLISGELHRGAEPDWQFVNAIPTIEMQLEDPSTSRRIWTVEHDGKLYVWSGYMRSAVGRLWKQWPVQAEQTATPHRRHRYLRHLERIQTGEALEGIAAAISAKYPSRPTPLTRAVIERGDVWVFEARARQP